MEWMDGKDWVKACDGQSSQPPSRQSIHVCFGSPGSNATTAVHDKTGSGLCLGSVHTDRVKLMAACRSIEVASFFRNIRQIRSMRVQESISGSHKPR